MKFLNLLLVVGPALFTTSHLASALPTRGPLITVPGNFSAVSHQEAEYEGIVQRLKKAQASSNSSDVNATITDGSDSANGTATGLLSGNSTSLDNSTLPNGNSSSLGISGNSTSTPLPTDSGPGPQANSTAAQLPNGNTTVNGTMEGSTGNSTVAQLPAGNATAGDSASSINSTSTQLPAGNSTVGQHQGSANSTSVQLPQGNATVSEASNITSIALPKATSNSNGSSSALDGHTVTAAKTSTTAKPTKFASLSTWYPPKGASTRSRASSSKTSPSKSPSKTTSSAADAEEISTGTSTASGAAGSTAAPGPEGGRDRWTAGAYGKNDTSSDDAGKNGTTSTTASSNASAATTTVGTGNSTTVIKGNSKFNGTTTINHGDNGTVVISWLADGPSSKGGSPTCSVSIKSNGANGTEINTVGIPSANVTSQHSASADQGAEVRRCATVSTISRTREADTRNLVTQKMQQLKKQHNHAKDAKSTDLRHALAAQNITIPVVFHIITDGDKGNVSDADVGKQMDVLNQDYKDYGFAFTLNSTNRVDNGTWFNGASYGGDIVYEMKTSLRQGGADTLNVYTVDFNDGVLGFATFPWDYEDSPKEDGIVIQYSTLPGGSVQKYNLGKTTTHEAGHFLGLYHTFQSGCTSPGDFVDDTPPSASPTSGCPTKRDTCKGDDLDDPIHNYMDYSTDDCLTEFTTGQAVRMQAMTQKYRLGQNVTSTS